MAEAKEKMKWFLWFLFLILEVFLLVATGGVSGQQINTVEVGSTRYFISDSSPYAPRLNWFLAYQYCRNIGMELLTQPRQEEALELMNFLTETGKSHEDYWTSSNQLGSPMWIWMTTGHPLNSTFNFWEHSGPPLTKTQRSCMNLQNRLWSASNCMDAKSFICQLTRCYYFNYIVTNTAATRQGSNTQTTSTTRNPFNSFPSQSTLIKRPNSRQPPSLSTTTGSLHDNRDKGPVQEVEASVRNPPVIRQQFTSTTGKLTNQFRPSASPIDRSDHQNEIVPALPKLLMVPLSQELVPPRVTSFNGIPKDNSAVNPATMRILRRKEAFSWALADDKKIHS